MKHDELASIVTAFSRRIKNSWQIIFLAAVVPYALSLLHYFYYRPGLRISLLPYLKALDLASFVIALGLALLILALKRKYFSRKFSRIIVEQALRQNPESSLERLLSGILHILRRKMTLVWILGWLMVLDGVIFYWLTFSERSNMHMYFVVGAFSLFMNYPRQELFSDLPGYIREGKREFAPPQQAGAGEQSAKTES